MRFPLAVGADGEAKPGPWVRQFAITPMRVENKVIWLESYYVRLCPIKEYTTGPYKHSRVQYSYTWQPEYRLPENIDKEYECH